MKSLHIVTTLNGDLENAATSAHSSYHAAMDAVRRALTLDPGDPLPEVFREPDRAQGSLTYTGDPSGTCVVYTVTQPPPAVTDLPSFEDLKGLSPLNRNKEGFIVLQQALKHGRVLMTPTTLRASAEEVSTLCVITDAPDGKGQVHIPIAVMLTGDPFVLVGATNDDKAESPVEQGHGTPWPTFYFAGDLFSGEVSDVETLRAWVDAYDLASEDDLVQLISGVGRIPGTDAPKFGARWGGDAAATLLTYLRKAGVYEFLVHFVTNRP